MARDDGHGRMAARWKMHSQHVRQFLLLAFPGTLPAPRLGNQIVHVMLDAVSSWNTVTAIVIGSIMAWTTGWNSLKFSVVNWTGTAYFSGLLLSGSCLHVRRAHLCGEDRHGFHRGDRLHAGCRAGSWMRCGASHCVQHIVIPPVALPVICLVFFDMLSQGAAILAAMLAVRWWFDVSFTIFLRRAVFSEASHPPRTRTYGPPSWHSSSPSTRAGWDLSISMGAPWSWAGRQRSPSC